MIESSSIKSATKRLTSTAPVMGLLIIATTVIAAGTITAAFACSGSQDSGQGNQGSWHHHYYHYHHHHWKTQGDLADASGNSQCSKQ